MGVSKSCIAPTKGESSDANLLMHARGQLSCSCCLICWLDAGIHVDTVLGHGEARHKDRLTLSGRTEYSGCVLGLAAGSSASTFQSFIC